MSGDKLSKINKAEVLLLPLTIRDDFNATIRAYRLRFAIPVHGFSNIENISKWLASKGQRISNQVHERETKKNDRELFHDLGFKIGLSEILKIYGLPLTSGLVCALEKYVLSDNKFKIASDDQNTSCSLEVPTEKTIKQAGRPFIKLWIYDTATTHKDVSAFVKNNWSTIQFFLKNKGRRIKAPEHTDLIQEIFKLDTLTTDELYGFTKLSKSKGGHSRYDLIAKILMLKGDDAGETVRRFLVRYRKKNRNM
jgi:hypothetical protein